MDKELNNEYKQNHHSIKLSRNKTKKIKKEVHQLNFSEIKRRRKSEVEDKIKEKQIDFLKEKLKNVKTKREAEVISEELYFYLNFRHFDEIIFHRTLLDRIHNLITSLKNLLDTKLIAKKYSKWKKEKTFVKLLTENTISDYIKENIDFSKNRYILLDYIEEFRDYLSNDNLWNYILIKRRIKNFLRILSFKKTKKFDDETEDENYPDIVYKEFDEFNKKLRKQLGITEKKSKSHL